jgi:hypothetical protein
MARKDAVTPAVRGFLYVAFANISALHLQVIALPAGGLSRSFGKSERTRKHVSISTLYASRFVLQKKLNRLTVSPRAIKSGH